MGSKKKKIGNLYFRTIYRGTWKKAGSSVNHLKHYFGVSDINGGPGERELLMKIKIRHDESYSFQSEAVLEFFAEDGWNNCMGLIATDVQNLLGTEGDLLKYVKEFI